MSADLGLYIEANFTTFENNIVSNTTGVYCGASIYSNNCTIVNNTFINNAGAGLGIEYGYYAPANNTIAMNDFISNGYCGIEFYDAGENNKIYLNNFIGNAIVATTTETTAPTNTYWNATEPIDYTYNGATYTGYLGNFYDDYTGSDVSPVDGIGDTPYTVPDSLGTDYAPLMAGYENNGPQPPVADFSCDVYSGEAPLKVYFTDLSTDAESWSWDFDGDGSVDSTEQNPWHVYDTAGSYTVTLTVGNSEGTDSVTMTDCINVGEPVEGGWSSFQKDTYNTGVTSEAGPITAPDMNLSWDCLVHPGSMAGIDVEPLVVNDSVFVYAYANALASYNRTTGELNWKSYPPGGAFIFQLSTPAYGDGKIFAASSTGKVFAYDAWTGELLWEDMVPTLNPVPETIYSQLNTPILYDNGRIYFGEWGGADETPSKRYYCYTEDGERVWQWNATTGGSYYWSGATVIGDYLIFGEMGDGSSWTGSGSGAPCNVTSLYKHNGTLVDEITIDGASWIASSIAYCEDNNRIYFTTKAGQCVSIEMNPDGTFNDSSMVMCDFGVKSSCTPAVYNGRLYIGTGQFGTGSRLLLCLNSTDLSEIWNFTANGDIEASVVISTAYDDGDGEVYLYFTTNCDDGTAYCLKDNATNTQAPTPEWTFTPESSKVQYILQGVALADGWVYFGNDAGYLFGLTEGSVEPETPTLSFDSAFTSVIEGQETEIQIVADSFPEGLSGYNLTVTVDDPAIADITGISYPSWVTVTENSSLPGSSVYLAALDGEEVTQQGAEDVVLATLTVSGKDMGLANLSLAVTRLDDDSGYHIESELASGEVEVTLFTLPDQDNSPLDLDGDGLYEDLTGNGEFTFVDIVVYFHNIEWIAENLPTEYFDFNGNGRTDYDDIVDMFRMLN
jgi:outer membrane protein assembly factor BamB